MADYYPQARVRLVIRFDEFDATNTPEPPKKPPQLRTGKDDPQLNVTERTTRTGGSILLLEPKGQGSQIGPSATQVVSKDGRTHVIDGVVPITANHARNGIRIADTLKLTIPFGDFPFDPRLVRSCGVEYFLGTVKAEDFYADVSGADRFDGAAPPLNMLPDFFTDSRGRERSNLRFQGWVDDWKASFTEDGEPTINLDCTDETRLLIDQDAPPKLTINPDVELDRAIANYLANFPQFRGFAVQYRPTEATRPILKDVFAKTAFKPTLGPAPNGGGKLSVWDYFTDVCGAVGHVCYVDLQFLSDGSAVPVIVIQRPRTLYGARFSGRSDDPYTGRILPSGRELLARTFVYGINTLSLDLSRKFSRYAPQNIEVRCYAPKQKKTLVVRYPDEKDKRQKHLLTGDQAEQKWEVIRVQGISDEATLRVIAQGVYEQRMRNELGATITTKELASLGGSNNDPDVFDMMAGDTVEIEVARETEAANTIVTIENQASVRAEEFLVSLGYSEELATAYGIAVKNLHFPTSFRVRQIATDWIKEEGVTVTIEACNYLEVKSDRELPAGEEQDPDTAATAEPERVTVE